MNNSKTVIIKLTWAIYQSIMNLQMNLFKNKKKIKKELIL